MTKTEKEIYEKALEFATLKHQGQIRKGGLPYITHPVSVANIVREKGYGLKYQITALFHDLLEDTDATEKEILDIGGEEVLKAVKLLTKEEGYVMDEYVSAIRKNDIAFVVKGADRLHNLKSAVVTSDDFKKRYILESLDYYMDFDKDIPLAVKELASSLKENIREEELKYKPIDKWLEENK